MQCVIPGSFETEKNSAGVIGEIRTVSGLGCRFNTVSVLVFEFHTCTEVSEKTSCSCENHTGNL